MASVGPCKPSVGIKVTVKPREFYFCGRNNCCQRSCQAICSSVSTPWVAGHRHFSHLHYHEILISFTIRKGIHWGWEICPGPTPGQGYWQDSNIQACQDLACKHSILETSLYVPSPPLLVLVAHPHFPHTYPQRRKSHLVRSTESEKL